MTAPPPRIGYLIQQFVPEVGAGPARAAEMALRWRDRGAQVTIVTAMPNRPVGRIHSDYRGRLLHEETWQGIRVLRSWLFATRAGGLGPTLLNNGSFLATSLINLLGRELDIDVLIASSPPFFPHFAGALVQGLTDVPLVLELRDLWPDYLVGMGIVKSGVVRDALFAVERQLLSRATHVVVVTDAFRRRAIEKGVDPGRVTVVSNGVDPAFYRPADEPPPLPELEDVSVPRIGYLGNFGRGQDLRVVVAAAVELDRMGVRFRMVLAGDGPERERIEALVEQHRLTQVTIHPPLSKDRTRSFYNACEICLVPLAPIPVFQETVPSKLFEVLACGRPVVAALDGEAGTIVQASGGGVTCPPGDPAGLARAIAGLLQTSATDRGRMGAKGREFVRQHYSRDVLATRYYECLEAVGRRT